MKFIKYIWDLRKLVYAVLCIAFIVAIIWYLASLVVDSNFDWLSLPISELKIWHLFIMMLIAGALTRD